MTSQAAGELISLPEGGGAVRGVGETFQPDVYTGTARFSVPITVPTGRGGMQPRLSLSYSSAAGNGPFGLGWNIDVPGVRRKTAKGFPRYDGTDVFVLSGTENLAPVPGGNTAAGEQRYRPRTEGLFARITHHRGGGQDYWEVLCKDGLRSRYGTRRPTGEDPATWRDPATVCDPNDRTHVLAWLLTETADGPLEADDPADLARNRIRYSYTGDPAEPASPQRYLSEVRYADHGSRSAPQFLISVNFRYEPRPDPFSDRRGGFEVATTWRGTRVETWTHAGRSVLSRSVNLTYANDRRAGANGVSLLARVVMKGHDGAAEEALPPLEFGYTRWEPTSRRYRPLSAAGGHVPPVALGHGNTDLVDLFGDGLPSVLQLNGVARYWRNRGGGRFDPPRSLPFAPRDVTIGAPGAQLADIDGDGRTDLLVTNGTQSGYYPLRGDGGFDRRGYVAHRQAPAVDLADPQVRLVDLTGDGAMDAVRTGSSVEVYFNDRRDGWSKAQLRRRADAFPVAFGDPRVKLADMTGDGMTDVVLVHDRQLRYWPNLGHGRWGAPVTMAIAPGLRDAGGDGPDGYDPRRVVVGDVDGDGCADLVYVGDRHLVLWVNRGGRSFAPPVVIGGTPRAADMVSVRLADMSACGTAGVLWTYDAGTQRDSTYKFLDLTGGVKPYLLGTVDNHMGARTTIEYAPSTRFLLDDAQDGRPWRTVLPFPVSVVARTTVSEEFSGNRVTSEFRYHHGYWDGAEREFRGFARVDRRDAETIAGGTAPAHHAPPTETRTWFHLGPVGPEAGGWTAGVDLSDEFWPGDPSLLGSTDTSGLPPDLPRRALRDAMRALAGRPLRTEVYGLDGTTREARPYGVTEHRYGIATVLDGRPADDRGWRARPVFFPHSLAERTTEWDRGDDPMTEATFTDGYDRYGRERQTTAIAVPRGRNPRVAAAPATTTPYLATTAVVTYATQDDAARYLVDRVASAARYELVNDGSPTLEQLHARAVDGTAARDLRGLELTYYDGPAFEGLPGGELGRHGLAVRTEQLAFTAEMAGTLMPAGPPPYLVAPVAAWPAEYPAAFRAAMADGAGYRRRDPAAGIPEGYYVQSRQVRLDLHDDPVGGRGLTVSERDPVGNEVTVAYDAFGLLAVRVRDAVGLETTAEPDYRLLRPVQVTDSNGNRTRVGYTPLGLVAWTAELGQEGQKEGDTPQQPGVRFAYRLTAWDDSGPAARQPLSVHTTRRVEHRWETVRQENERRAAAGLPPLTDAEIAVLFPANEQQAFPSRFVASREYSDGLGRALHSRLEGDDIVVTDVGLPGNVDVRPINATGVAGSVVVVSGWTAYDNKGRVVQTWEPFFDTGWDYKPPAAASLAGPLASTATRYDTRGRAVRVIHPDGSEDTVVHGVPADLANPAVFVPTPWEAYAYDANDNADRTHPAESAAWSDHRNTPASTRLDALGRTVEAVVRTATERHVSRSSIDIDGRVLDTTDPLGRVASRSRYDLLGRVWVSELLDAGAVHQVLDAAGAAVERRDAKGALALHQYDALRRPVGHWCADRAGTPTTMRVLTVYGDDASSGLSRAAAAAANLLGRPYRRYDEAGLLTAARVDLLGNVVEQHRRVLSPTLLTSRLPAGAGDWTGVGYVVEWQPPAGTTVAAHAETLLDPTAYVTTSRHDALGRRTKVVLPQDVEGKRRTITLGYGRSGRLARVHLDGQATVGLLAYNARGQRVLAELGNGLMVRYAYDARTFRLARLRTEGFSRQPGTWTWVPRDAPVQDHGYRYDLAGNLLQLQDRTPGCGLPPANPDRLDRSFRYDPLNRLVSATGRECKVPLDAPWSPAPRCTDITAAQAYREDYTFDPVGSVLQVAHQASAGSWTSTATLGAGGNRLQSAITAGSTVAFTYDACGNLTQEGTSRIFEWDAANRLTTFRVQAARLSPPSQYVQYRYDSNGQRVLKVVRDQGGALATTIYDGPFERLLFTKRSGKGATVHDSVHLLDGSSRLAVVRVGPPAPADTSPPVVYHVPDHLGSSEVVTDAGGGLVNREEFTPYGITSFGSYARKRYRFTGKERDEESGLSHHGERYYAPWICRWISCDPAGHVDGPNLYAYALGNSMALVDPSGRSGEPPDNDGRGRQPAVHHNVGAGGTGIMAGAPRGPTLVVPNSYDGAKMRDYGEAIVKREIGKVTNTRPIRTEASNAAGVKSFRNANNAPTSAAPGGKGWAVDHKIELQHDITGRKGANPNNLRWQDFSLNSSEGSKSRHLQKNLPGIDGADVLSGNKKAPTIYGGMTKEAGASKWYNTPEARGAVRGFGAVMSGYGAYQSGDAVAGAIVNDALSGSSHGQYTARDVATQAGGWAGAAALGAKGAAIGAAIGAPFAGVGAVIGGAVGGLVGGAIGFTIGSVTAEAAVNIGVQATGATAFVPADLR